jgi:hypothetical protein
MTLRRVVARGASDEAIRVGWTMDLLRSLLAVLGAEIARPEPALSNRDSSPSAQNDKKRRAHNEKRRRAQNDRKRRGSQ